MLIQIYRIEDIKIDSDRPEHPSQKTITKSIKKNGVINPILIDEEKRLIDGLGRLRGCKELGIINIQCTVCTIEQGYDYEKSASSITTLKLKNEIKSKQEKK